MVRQHLIAWAENVDQALLAINPVTTLETQIPTSGDDFIIPADLRHVAMAFIGAPTIDSARFVAGSLYEQFPGGGPDLQPFNVGAEPLSPTPLIDWRDMPLELADGDRLQLHIANSGAGAGEDAYGFVWLTDGPLKAAQGKWRPMKFTTTAAAVTAEAWTARTLAASQTIVPGRYEVGGAFAVSTTGRAMRLVFTGQAHKPGVLIADAESDIIRPDIFRNGGMGVLGSFRHDQLPQIELLCDAADNEVQEVYLDVRKVA